MDYAELKFVTGHTGNPINPVLTNLLVYTDADGRQRAQAQNGRFTVDVATDLPSMMINADRLAAVWASAKATPTVKLGDQFLTITAGRMRARVAIQDPAAYPRDTPDTESSHGVAGLAETLRQLLPFVAGDASRPWATAICLAPAHAYATNNVALVRMPLDIGLTAPVNLPGQSVAAILQQGVITGLGASENAVTFYMEGDVWIKAKLVTGEWPYHVVDQLVTDLPDAWLTVNPELEPMLRVASKLADARHPVVQFNGTSLFLMDESLVADDLQPVPDAGKVNANMAALVFEYAGEVQWHTPRQDVHAFRAGSLVGVFGGQR